MRIPIGTPVPVLETTLGITRVGAVMTVFLGPPAAVRQFIQCN